LFSQCSSLCSYLYLHSVLPRCSSQMTHCGFCSGVGLGSNWWEISKYLHQYHINMHIICDMHNMHFVVGTRIMVWIIFECGRESMWQKAHTRTHTDTHPHTQRERHRGRGVLRVLADHQRHQHNPIGMFILNYVHTSSYLSIDPLKKFVSAKIDTLRTTNVAKKLHHTVYNM